MARQTWNFVDNSGLISMATKTVVSTLRGGIIMTFDLAAKFELRGRARA